MAPTSLVIVTEHLSDEALRWLAERCTVVRARPGEPDFAAAAPRASALVVRTYTTVDDRLLAGLPALRVVGRGGVGLDNIDLDACQRRGIAVVSTPDANTQAVVEYVTCLLCDALRPRAPLPRAVPKEEWDRLRDHDYVARRQMNELTLGILGLGRIGRRVSDVAGAVGFTVRFNDIRGIPDDERGNAEPVDVDTLFRVADVLTIHIDGRAANRRFVGERLLSLMRDDVVLINTSRGMVLDHDALAAWLDRHPRAMALLDVHEPEPVVAANPLLGRANVRLYPHLASRTLTATANMSWVVRDVVKALEQRQTAVS